MSSVVPMYGFGGGGGGGGLNFKVICNPQPSTAKENTIWVDTDRINNYYFSATQPENMVEYDVWFPIGTSSSVAFSATKKNPVMVYPLSAKQYIGGALVDKVAKSYQGSKWVDWVTYLYKSGNEYTDITGGWTSSGFTLFNLPVLAATKNTGSMSLTTPSSGVCPAATSKLMPLGNVKKITVTYKNKTVSGGFGLQLSINSEKNIESNSKLLKKFSAAADSMITEQVEIPSGTGECYIIFYCTNGRAAEIFDIWYE